MLSRSEAQVWADDFFNLIHRFNDGVADLLAFFGAESGQEAVRFSGTRADPDRQVIGPPVVQKALARNFHSQILVCPTAPTA